ncbi:PssE/Cps14G family polysaccharide biosynthesis glycosyltransferase [Eisenbergiella massiliensis]|uniref:PssE/Cps14G family polysaccharide biosynthesis glycosyltransferase n=1 Tax=Eisenbergiella massiliensis TaxID=1720294 RepID=UPI0039944F06
MIFITTGSRSFQFDRLLKAVDEAVENGGIKDDIFAQIGASTYKIKNYRFVEFLNQEEFNQKMHDCDIVLTHGGTGVIVSAVKMGKRVVAVPRLVQYQEVVDDHQIQLVEAFEKAGMVTGCFDCNKIGAAIEEAKGKVVKPYVSNTQTIINSIDELICGKNHSNKIIRILMCSSDRKEKGGMNSVIDQLMDHNWGQEFQFSYLATHVTGNLVKKILFFAIAYRKLKRLIKNDSFDIIHIHMSYNGSFYRKYYITKLCKKYGKKVIIHLHGSEFKDFYNRGNKKRKLQIKELFTVADCSIVLGEDWKNFIEKIAPNAKIVVINNAVPIPEVQEKIIMEERTFLFLGALIKRKGVMDLLTALNQMKQKNILGWHVLIAGSGEEQAALKEFVKNNDLENMVDLLGWVKKEQKSELFGKSDVLVLPSYNEGLPMAILEAMSYGLSIVSTNIGSIGEAVHNGENGFLFKPGDVVALERAITELVRNADIWKRQSVASRKICEERFSEDMFFRKIQAIYYSLYKGMKI